MMRFAIAYRRPMCKCGSRLVTHVEVAAEVWRFGCSMCKTEIDKAAVVQVEAEEWYVPAKPFRSMRDRQNERSDNQPTGSGERGSEAQWAAG
jgi:hypothetical protein